MAVEVVTVEDLEEFRRKLLDDIKEILKAKPEKKWLKTQDVMDMLDISDVKLQGLRNSKQIPFKKLGGVCYYNADEIENFLNNL